MEMFNKDVVIGLVVGCIFGAGCMSIVLKGYHPSRILSTTVMYLGNNTWRYETRENNKIIEHATLDGGKNNYKPHCILDYSSPEKRRGHDTELRIL